MTLLSREEGGALVRWARKAIEARLTGGDFSLGETMPPSFKEKRGVFVTLKTHEKGDLRGCIGFPEPVMPLLDATLNAAVAAALKDPRFRPVGQEEMGSLVVEVTVLTPPERIEATDPEKIISEVKVGIHGLMVRYITGRAGLLLPQVAVENRWSPEEFLAATCLKAGLPRDTWTHPDCEIYRFRGQIFTETAPGGDVVEENIG